MRFRDPFFCVLTLVLLTSRLLLAAEPTEGTFQASDGVKIHYLELGRSTATGAPVVLIHGFSGTAHGNWFLNGVADALLLEM